MDCVRYFLKSHFPTKPKTGRLHCLIFPFLNNETLLTISEAVLVHIHVNKRTCTSPCKFNDK